MTKIYEAFAKGCNLGALFIDIEGAFDFVILEKLIEDLIELGLDDNYIRLIKNILMNRQLNFFHNGRKIGKKRPREGFHKDQC